MGLFQVKPLKGGAYIIPKSAYTDVVPTALQDKQKQKKPRHGFEDERDSGSDGEFTKPAIPPKKTGRKKFQFDV